MRSFLESVAVDEARAVLLYINRIQHRISAYANETSTLLLANPWRQNLELLLMQPFSLFPLAISG